MTSISIELIIDFICPWCYLGKSRIDRIQKQLADELAIEVNLKPYLLHPYIPKGGLPKEQFAKKTKHGFGRALKMETGIEGININYHKISVVPSSLEAYRLLALTPQKLKSAMTNQIFYAYFEEGLDIENHDVLIQIAKSVGYFRF